MLLYIYAVYQSPLMYFISITSNQITTPQFQHFYPFHSRGNRGGSGSSQLNVVWDQTCSDWFIWLTSCALCVPVSHLVSLRRTQGVERISMHINKSCNTKRYKMGTNYGAQIIWWLWRYMVGNLEYSWKMKSDLSLKSKLPSETPMKWVGFSYSFS